MIDQRLASVSRNLRAEGYVDNDPDATLAAIRLIALADVLAAQQTDALVPPGAGNTQLASGSEQSPARDGAG